MHITHYYIDAYTNTRTIRAPRRTPSHRMCHAIASTIRRLNIHARPLSGDKLGHARTCRDTFEDKLGTCARGTIRDMGQ